MATAEMVWLETSLVFSQRNSYMPRYRASMRVATCQPNPQFEVINAGRFVLAPEDLNFCGRSDKSVVLCEGGSVWLLEVEKV
jgi:hypothetical protein